ncbi:MAG TPA: tRNA (adenosine(37)-N6)-dimethylallyltransferase MiaA [Candidatus Saccharimonadales bacterium]|nr:tRNA (adenosine(37)-N6)-dimethylallyltransferase MiaA [Candidatus Saccharimonadales bacterium]
MVRKNQQPITNGQLLVIVGPTASGKSALALKAARNYGGEIISADSLTVYKRMDIGTAKPSPAERRQVPHWGLDIIGPGERFTAAGFKSYAEDKIAEARQRGKLPIVAGGTGLYVDSLLYDFKFSPEGSERDPRNPRHLKKTGKLSDNRMRPDVLLIGLMPLNEVLKQNIANRAEKMFKDGLIEETQSLIKLYGQDSLLAKAKVAYGPVISYLNGALGRDEALKQLKTLHWQYARRQKTWFKRNRHIQWFGSAEEAYKFIAQKLNN